MANILLKASGPNVTYYLRSGTVVSDANGIISTTPYGDDLTDLEHQGCVPIKTGGADVRPPFVSGRFYGVPKGCTPTAVLTVTGKLYAYPVVIPAVCTLDSLNISVTTGQTGGLARAALYSDNGAGYPGAIVPGTDTGDLDGTATAVVLKGTLGVALNPGLYWVVSCFKATTTMPSVIGTAVSYAHELTSLLGFDTAAHALAASAEAVSGIIVTATYPATSMTVSFPTFPASATLQLNAATPIAALGIL